MKNHGDGDEKRASIGILIGYNAGSGKNTGNKKDRIDGNSTIKH